MSAKRHAPSWFEEAVRDPGSVFSTPEEVFDSPDLTQVEKIQVLRSWEYDAAELEVAQEEGMRGEENGLVQRILLALARLTGGDDTSLVSPSKQHGLMRSSGDDQR